MYAGTITKCSKGNTVTFDGNVQYTFTDRYEFQSRTGDGFTAVPGLSISEDRNFWLLQQHGYAKGFNVFGVRRKPKTLTWTGQVTAPSPPASVGHSTSYSFSVPASTISPSSY
jgi:hypothetical protein